MIAALILSVALVGTSLVVWWCTREAAEGRLALNSWVGIRTSATLASPQAWVAGHRAALPGAARLAWVTSAVAVLMLALIAAGVSVGTTGLVQGAWAVAFVLWAVWLYLVAHRAAKAAG